MAKKNVNFIVSLEDCIDEKEFRDEFRKVLERELGKDAKNKIDIISYVGRENALMCRTDRETYEKLFETQLEFDPSQKNKVYYTAEGYKEMKKTTIPEGFREKVKCVHLDKNWKMQTFKVSKHL